MPDKAKLSELVQRLFTRQSLHDEELKELYRSFNREEELAATDELLEDSWQSSVSNTDRIPNVQNILKAINERSPTGKAAIDKRRVQFYQKAFTVAACTLILVMLAIPLFFQLKTTASGSNLLTEETAPMGKIRKFELPDGTKIWLSPGSSVIYPLNLDRRKTRTIGLSGQALFEVAKNEQKPFILEMGDIGLKVLGTSFNVTSYKEDPTIDIALKEGKIVLFEGNFENARQFTELSPGQAARYTKGQSGFSIQASDLDRISSWLNGDLVFRDERMANVFRQLERWYNVRILVDDPAINDYLFTATIKTEDLDKILELIEFTSKLDCSYIENNGFQSYKPTILIKNSMK